jgi:hypothetical protein
MAESIAEQILATGTKRRRAGGGKTRRRSGRPFKWQTIFAELRISVDMLAQGNRPGAIERIGGAADWAQKWCGRFRQETSMGVTIAEAIEENIVGPLSAGATIKQLQLAISVLERVVTREANQCAVVRAQHQLRQEFRGRTPDEARDRAVQAALRQVRGALASVGEE